jgi:hypothetical protein
MNSKNKSDNVIFYVEVIFLWTMFVHNKEKYLYYTFENIFLYCHWRSNNKEWSVQIPLPNITPPHGCVSHKPGPGFPTSHVVVLLYVQWFKVRDDSSFC